MDSTPAPWQVKAAAGLAAVIALYDAVETILLLMRPEGTGAVVGTFVRDGLLLAGAVLVMRRTWWAYWLLAAMLLLTLVRVVAGGPWLRVAVNLLAIPAGLLLAHSASRAWLRRPAPAQAP